MKFLGAGAVGLFSNFAWPDPGTWVEAAEPVAECTHGIHAIRPDQLLDWIDDELWEIELAGDVTERESMVIAERARLLRRFEAWNGDTARSFTQWCAARSRRVAGARLRAAGLNDAADRLEAASDLAGMHGAAIAALDHVRDIQVESLVAFAADMVALASGERPELWLRPDAGVRSTATAGAIAANVAFVAAHVAGCGAAAEHGTDDAYVAAFGAERTAQLNEFVKRARL